MQSPFNKLPTLWPHAGPLSSAVAVLRTAAFIVSVVGALAVLPLLGLVKLPAASPRAAAAAAAVNRTRRTSPDSAGSSCSSRAEAAARPSSDGEVPPLTPQQWALTLLPAGGGAADKEAQHKRMPAAAMGPSMRGREGQKQQQHQESAGSDGSTTPSGEWQMP